MRQDVRRKLEEHEILSGRGIAGERSAGNRRLPGPEVGLLTFGEDKGAGAGPQQAADPASSHRL